jgi:site-specific recombinase XerD
MSPAGRLPRNSTNWLLDSQLAPYAYSFKHHLTERRYASSSVDVYVACIAEFALWMSQCGLEVDGVDDDAVQRFLDNHLLQCKNASAGRRKYCLARAFACLTA